jgi:hypothetical protein
MNEAPGSPEREGTKALTHRRAAGPLRTWQEELIGTQAGVAASMTFSEGS